VRFGQGSIANRGPIWHFHCFLKADLLDSLLDCALSHFARIARTVPGSMKFRIIATFTSLALVFGCSSTPEQSAPTGKTYSGTDEHIFLNDTIEKNYDPHVIMKRAESFFEQAAYPEAIVEYQHFIDMHRVHVLAAYAQYKLGESHLKMAKSVDRDPEPVKKAQEAFEKLLKSYPGSKYEVDAVEKIRECQNWLAEVNFFVGRFYYRRGAYLAAAHRFEAILEDDPELKVAPDALYYLALTYKEIGADDWARENLTLLATRYPDNKHRKKSQALLAQLNGGVPEVSFAQLFPNTPEESSVPALSFTGRTETRSLAAGLPQLNGTAEKTPPQQTVTPVSAIREVSPASSANSPEACRLGTWC
jgi:outer membrane protein assembly factor BamD